MAVRPPARLRSPTRGAVPPARRSGARLTARLRPAPGAAARAGPEVLGAARRTPPRWAVAGAAARAGPEVLGAARRAPPRWAVAGAVARAGPDVLGAARPDASAPGGGRCGGAGGSGCPRRGPPDASALGGGRCGGAGGTGGPRRGPPDASALGGGRCGGAGGPEVLGAARRAPPRWAEAGAVGRPADAARRGWVMRRGGALRAGAARCGARRGARSACAGRAPRCRARACSAAAPAGTDQAARTRMQSAVAKRLMATPSLRAARDPRSGTVVTLSSMLRANCRLARSPRELPAFPRLDAARPAPGVTAGGQGVRLRARSPGANPRSIEAARAALTPGVRLAPVREAPCLGFGRPRVDRLYHAEGEMPGRSREFCCLGAVCAIVWLASGRPRRKSVERIGQSPAPPPSTGEGACGLEGVCATRHGDGLPSMGM